MKDSEAVKKLEMLNDALNENFAEADECSEALQMAIKALKKQDKIKEVFTHYIFAGNKTDIFNFCISALSEIKTILEEE